MTVMPQLKLVLLAFSCSLAAISLSARADTNLAGDEITVQIEQSTGYDQGPGLNISPDSQLNPTLNYLPDTPSNESAESAADTGSDAVSSRPTVVSDDLWQRIKDGYAMPEAQSEYTATHESWYASRPDYVKRMVARSQKYLFHIVEEVEKRGMPTEIALLPMIESAFNPQANSRSSASGIWQFVPATGKDFGLKQNWWVDNRRDITAATNAALTYLQKLHVMFGTWDLALAAYNAGEGTVQRAIERNRRQGLPTDYASLSLPPETKNYVPKLQAVKNIMSNPEQYGLNIQSIANRPYFIKVDAPQQIDAHLAAQLAEISPEEFASLNPEYNRPVLTASGNVHEILLPVGAAQAFKDNLANNDKPLVSWQTYHAKRGERMESISRKFGIGLAQLRDVNDLPARNKMMTSTALLVPSKGFSPPAVLMSEHAMTSDDKAVTASDRAEPAASDVKHTVKNNETIQIIAQRYGVSVKQLTAMNHLKTSRLHTNQKLLVSVDTTRHAVVNTKPAKTLAKSNAHYVVRRGDTLDSIARKFDVARDDLQRWNNINDSHVMPGHKLTVLRPDEA